MHKLRQYALYFRLAILVVLLFLLNWSIQDQAAVEQYYSRLFYPIFSEIPKFLVGWFPWSVGDIVYACLFIFLLCYLFQVIRELVKRNVKLAFQRLLAFVAAVLSIYLYFNISWGINYNRTAIAKEMKLDLDTVLLNDHIQILTKHIEQVNILREKLSFEKYPLSAINEEVMRIMQEDLVFPMLSKTQIQIKSPINNTLASYFGVSGYFNPFTHEAHANTQMPKASYPFMVAHELAHQMGIGFEDECNFIAYVKLHQQENPKLAYAAYYESVNYLLRSLYLVDQHEFEKMKSLLSEQVLSDLKEEQKYWKNYTGWLTSLSSLFYDQYLKHNNQAEGMARYGMVSRLIIAYEVKNNNQSVN
ncbi:DUF3810 domain-containing protein [Sphingobacterium sp. HJSM2_6]|uniref:DUF3810 domain-containing protein n=1 Tax=Sphingobacterium sp. HJSM2_6 TaxID=3366264 RepID=UPI003BE5FC2C